jgi:hypothetical protein
LGNQRAGFAVGGGVTLPQTAAAIPISAPVGGVNYRDPLVGMEEIYAPQLINFTPEARYVETRKPWKIHATLTAGELGQNIYGLAAWRPQEGSAAKLFAITEGPDGGGDREIWDVTTATPTKAVDMATSVSDEMYPAYFNANMALMTEYVSESYRYNGSTWTAWGLTYSSSTVGGRTVASYKGRIYLFTGRTCYYSQTIGAVTGASSLRNFGEILESAGDIWWAGVVASPSNVPNETYLAFGTNDGEVLVYGGDYPDSASWSIVGRYRTSPPTGYNSILQIQNDILLMTTSGVISIRDLMGRGSIRDADQMLSALIAPYWSTFMGRLSAWQRGRVSATYWPEEDKVYILVPGHLFYNIYNDPTINDAEATMFVYNMQTRAWGVHRLVGVDGDAIGALTYSNNSLYFYTGNVIMTINKSGTGESAYKDEIWDDPGKYEFIPIDMQTAPINFGTRKQVHAFEATVNSKETGESLLVSAISDLGRSESSCATVPLTGGYAIPHYGVGTIGRFAQMRMYGFLGPSVDSSTAGIKIYSLGVIAS